MLMRYVVGGVALVSVAAHASMRSYQANLDQSIWSLTAATPLECRLEHPIPKYGYAYFVSRAGKQINLDFFLDGKLPQAQTQKVMLRAEPQSWHPGSGGDEMATLQFFQQFDGYVEGQVAWTMLSELDSGRMPTFYLEDWYRNQSTTAIGLSSANFHPQYEQFKDCVDQLLPFSFADISFSILNYESNSDQLTKRSRQRLEMIAEYVRNDLSIEMIEINGYSDSYGGRWANQELSEKRAEAIRAFFVSLGIPEMKIRVEGFGETRHAASNETLLGRQKNRRVVISMNAK